MPAPLGSQRRVKPWLSLKHRQRSPHSQRIQDGFPPGRALFPANLLHSLILQLAGPLMLELPHDFSDIMNYCLTSGELETGVSSLSYSPEVFELLAAY